MDNFDELVEEIFNEIFSSDKPTDNETMIKSMEVEEC